MNEKKEYYLDFYCPSCGTKHTNVRQGRYSEEETYVARFDIDCPCGREISTYASLNWDYVDIVAKNIDGEIAVREEVVHES